MTAYTFDVSLFSDLHKDAYGFRPRSYCEFYDASDDQKQIIWDQTLETLEAANQAERTAHERAISSFKNLISEVLYLGAADVETALRWILVGEKFSLNDYQYGADYIAYHFGLPYANEWRDLLDKITHAMVCELYEENAA